MTAQQLVDDLTRVGIKSEGAILRCRNLPVVGWTLGRKGEEVFVDLNLEKQTRKSSKKK